MTVPSSQNAAAGPLRGALAGRFLAHRFGSGVDSTAMLVALCASELRPDVITFADTGCLCGVGDNRFES